jgi:anionic cell wall polymer biosynthesis LytR-Cps2A-Psr (LCP) family protein
MGRLAILGRVKDGVRPSAPPLPETDVVDLPPPPGFRRRIPSKRVRRRWLAAFLAVWALVVLASAFAWYEYGRLSHDLTVSNRRVGGRVQRALTPAPVTAERQTTLVAGIDSHQNVAGTVILARMDATRHAVEILTVPSTVGVTPAQSLRDVLRFDGVPRAIGVLERDLGVPVNHVLLMRLSQAGSIVRSLGGITVTNPMPVAYNVTGGRGVFPAGRVHLTGRTVQWYLDPTERPLPRRPAAGDFRQAAVVRGVTDRLVHITAPSDMSAIGETIARSFTTDLSPDPVLGIVAARLKAHTLYDCRLGAGADLAQAGADATVAGFQRAARTGACTAQPLHTTLPVAALAATIITTLVAHGGSRLLYLLVVASVAVWGIAAVAWVLMLPAVRGLRPRRRLRRRGMRLPEARLPQLRRPRVHLPEVHLPQRDHRRYGRVYRRRRRATIAVRVASVPVSIALGMLIAHVLY